MSIAMSFGGEIPDHPDVLDEVRRAYLTAYPNPDRIGCPSLQLINDFAAERFRPAPDSAFLRHLTRCSDCYAEFRKARDTRSGVAKSRMIRLAALAFVAVACGILASRLATKLRT